MERLVVFGVLVLAVIVTALLANRRRSGAPIRTGYAVPEHLDRADFDRPEAPWLVAVFTSSTCNSCARAMQVARTVGGPEVAVQEVELLADKQLHDRYRIEAVPSVVVADASGEVRAAFLGAASADDLRASLGELREPGSVAVDLPRRTDQSD